MLRLILTSLLLIAPALADWHTFTDTEGRSFVGKVTAVDSDAGTATVLSKRANRTAELSFDQLSEEDVTYLREWESSTDAEPGTSGYGSPDEDPTPPHKRLYPKTREEIRAGLAEINAVPPSRGIEELQQTAVNTLNRYRFLCGVPHDVRATAKKVDQATAAAKACKEHGGLSHDIGDYTDKCNLSSSPDIVYSVSQYIDDDGANNRERRGHRRWCLNPEMGTTGLGSGGDGYSAMWALDDSGSALRDPWSYPGMGFFPLDHLHGNAWSLYLTEDAPSKSELKVEVYKLDKRPEKPFSAKEEIPGRPLPVAYVSTYLNCINFEPQADPISEKGPYWVRITGGGIREAYIVELY